MKTIFTIFISIILILAVSCKGSQGKGKEACIEKPCNSACTKEYKPVCGCNEKTYGNACIAECHNIKQYTPGECPKKP